MNHIVILDDIIIDLFSGADAGLTHLAAIRLVGSSNFSQHILPCGNISNVAQSGTGLTIQRRSGNRVLCHKRCGANSLRMSSHQGPPGLAEKTYSRRSAQEISLRWLVTTPRLSTCVIFCHVWRHVARGVTFLTRSVVLETTCLTAERYMKRKLYVPIISIFLPVSHGLLMVLPCVRYQNCYLLFIM